jgi:hypothetical protein
MIKSIKENSIQLYNYFDEELEITNNWKNIQFYIIQFFIILIAFLLGRYMTKKHRLNDYLQSFNNSAKEYEKLENSIYFVNKLKKISSFIFWGLPLFIMGFFYALNKEELHNQDKRLKDKLLIVQEPVNMILILGNFTFFILNLIFLKFLNFRANGLRDKITNLTDCKTLYVEKFFDSIGYEMTHEIKKLLLNKENKKEIEIEKFKEENQKLTESNKELKKKHDFVLEKFLIYQDFVQKITSFEWCDICYDLNIKKPNTNKIENQELIEKKESNSLIEKDKKEKEISVEKEENASEEKENSGAKKDNKSAENNLPSEITNLLNDSNKSTGIVKKTINHCLNNCLSKYLLFCEEVGREFFKNLEKNKINKSNN